MIALLVALGFVVVCSGVALAGAGGECGYKTHSTQAGTDKVDTSAQPIASAPDKAEADKVLVAQTNNAGKPTAEIKK
jgi:hypothetical protein